MFTPLLRSNKNFYIQRWVFPCNLFNKLRLLRSEPAIFPRTISKLSMAPVEQFITRHARRIAIRFRLALHAPLNLRASAWRRSRTAKLADLNRPNPSEVKRS
jgi:hypothetical protein